MIHEVGPVMAKAVLYSACGGFEVVTVGQREVRAPVAGEIRIAVRAAAINPTDILLRDPGLGKQKFPLTPGMDAAGVVESVGAGVTRLKVGDEVMAAVSPIRAEGGAQASYVVVPAASAVLKPEGVSLIEATTLPMNGMTALYAQEMAGLAAGQVLGITGGAGWLAYMATTLARLDGITVVSDAKAQERGLVQDYGADIVVERGDFVRAVNNAVPGGLDAVLDTALLGEEAFAAIRAGGTYIPVRGWADSPRPDSIDIHPVMVNDVLERTEWLERLRREASEGRLVPRVAKTFALDDIVEAQRFLLAGGVRGRPVLTF